MAGSRRKAVLRMRYWCDIANLGYGQDTRNQIFDGGAADCSSLVLHVLREAGFDTGSAWYTGDMLQPLLNRGWRTVPVSQAEPGDVLLTPHDHTALVLEDGWHIGEALINEHGTITGGRNGDQTGRETWTGRVISSRSWQYCLRAPGAYTATDNDEEEELMSAANAILDSLATDWMKPLWKKIVSIEADVKDIRKTWLSPTWDKLVEVNVTAREARARAKHCEDLLINGSTDEGVWRPGALRVVIENQRRINELNAEVRRLREQIEGKA